MASGCGKWVWQVGVASGSGFTHKACAEELYRAQKRIVDIFVKHDEYFENLMENTQMICAVAETRRVCSTQACGSGPSRNNTTNSQQVGSR